MPRCSPRASPVVDPLSSYLCIKPVLRVTPDLSASLPRCSPRASPVGSSRRRCSPWWQHPCWRRRASTASTARTPRDHGCSSISARMTCDGGQVPLARRLNTGGVQLSLARASRHFSRVLPLFRSLRTDRLRWSVRLEIVVDIVSREVPLTAGTHRYAAVLVPLALGTFDELARVRTARLKSRKMRELAAEKAKTAGTGVGVGAGVGMRTGPPAPPSPPHPGRRRPTRPLRVFLVDQCRRAHRSPRAGYRDAHTAPALPATSGSTAGTFARSFGDFYL